MSENVNEKVAMLGLTYDEAAGMAVEDLVAKIKAL